jgi:DNA-binding transcriptional ArsR family regulator
MSEITRLASVAALLGDPARANILAALMDGRALTAKELAYAAHVSPSTTSGHLARLTDAELLAVEQQGRHRYFRLASPLVGQMLEAVMAVAGSAPRTSPAWRGGEALRTARTCYDHLAGRVGVAIADAMTQRDLVDWDHGLRLTPDGEQWLTDLAIEVPQTAKRPALRPCLDWTERRPHLAGAVGAALCGHALEQGWIKRVGTTRAVLVTPAGRDVLGERLGLSEQVLTPAGH